MSRHFTTTVIALLVIFGGFMTYLNYANSRLNAESLKRERESPCVQVPHEVLAENRGKACYLREAV